MSFWNTIATKEIDIYIGIATTLLGMLLTELLNYIKQKSAPIVPLPGAGGPAPANVLVHVPVSISTINNVYLNSSPSSNIQQSQIAVFLWIGLFAAAVTYLNLSSFILKGVTSALLLTMVFFAGVHLTGFIRGRISGAQWIAYLAYLAVFYLAAVMVRDGAVNPDYAPKYFVYSEAVMRKHGLAGWSRIMSIADMQWFAFHIAGVLLFLFAIARHVLAGVYLATMTWHLSFNPWVSAPPWLAVKTARYRHISKNIILTTVLLALSYALVTGNGYMWWTYEFPKLVNGLLDRIVHGAG